MFEGSQFSFEFSFPSLHKYELGGTAQVVPGGSGAPLLSPHMAIWSYVSKNDHQLTFKMLMTRLNIQDQDKQVLMIRMEIFWG